MLENRCLDKDVPIPLYFQLKNLIIEEIENGSYPVGSMIPTENELSQMFQISRTTVRQAISEMVREERLYRVKSKGTFVASPKINQEFIQNLQSFNDEMRHAGKTPSTEVLSLDRICLPESIAFHMGLEPGTEAIYLYRKRCADNIPIVRVETYLPYALCSFILGHDLSVESLYNILSQRETTKITHVTRVCEAVSACSEDVKILDMRRGRPVHHFHTLGYNDAGTLIEYSLAWYRGDQNRFQVEIRLK